MKKEDITKIANDERSLNEILIPAIRDASISQIEFVARYMGLSSDEAYGLSRLAKKSSENESAKRRMVSWGEKGVKVLCWDNFPAPDKDSLVLAGLVDKLCKKNTNFNFALYCGTVYFTPGGLEEIIGEMLRAGRANQAWIRDIRRNFGVI